MEEELPESLLKTADVMHWFGRYTTCNALVLTSRLLRTMKVRTLDELEAAVEAREASLSEGDGA